MELEHEKLLEQRHPLVMRERARLGPRLLALDARLLRLVPFQPVRRFAGVELLLLGLRLALGAEAEQGVGAPLGSILHVASSVKPVRGDVAQRICVVRKSGEHQLTAAHLLEPGLRDGGEGGLAEEVERRRVDGVLCLGIGKEAKDSGAVVVRRHVDHRIAAPLEAERLQAPVLVRLQLSVEGGRDALEAVHGGFFPIPLGFCKLDVRVDELAGERRLVLLLLRHLLLEQRIVLVRSKLVVLGRQFPCSGLGLGHGGEEADGALAAPERASALQSDLGGKERDVAHLDTDSERETRSKQSRKVDQAAKGWWL